MKQEKTVGAKSSRGFHLKPKVDNRFTVFMENRKEMNENSWSTTI